MRALQSVSALFGVIALLAPSVISAEEVPQRFRGVLGTASPGGACAADQPVVLLNAATVVFIDPRGAQTTVIMGDASWTDGAVLLSRGAEFSILPPLESFDRCSSPPSILKAVFGEALALFPAMDDLRRQCSGGQARRCVDQLIGVLDVSRDRRLSAAEISRGLRAVGAFFAYETAAARQRSQVGARASIAQDVVPLDSLYSGVLAVNFAAPFVTSSLLASYDYDGDGFLSAAELLQDREDLDLEAMTMALATRLGEDGVRGALSGLISLFGQAGGGLLPALTGFR